MSAWGRRTGRPPVRLAGALAALAMVVAATLSGCAADGPKPAPLEVYTPVLQAGEVWRADVGSVDATLQIPTPSDMPGGAFLVTNAQGLLRAYDPLSGRVLWSGSFGAPLASGLGSDGRFHAAVTQDGRVVVLDGQGRRLWDARVASPVVAAPLVAGERVFVIGLDRQVQAFDALDGRLLWNFQRSGLEALTLKLPAVLSAYQNTLLAGQGAVLVGLDPTRGIPRFEVPLTPPRGTNEVERLNDLVGPPMRVGSVVCARAFQTAVGCIDAARGTLRWSRVVGGQQPLDGDSDLLFGADASDRITAWRLANGETAWTNERLLNRGLTPPRVVGGAVVFGDRQGQVHFLSREDGRTLLRRPTDGSPVVGRPMVSGNTVLVVTRSGGLFAFRPQ